MKRTILLVSISIALFGINLNAAINDGLVGHWKLDGNAQDASGYGNHGILEGAEPAEDRFGNAESACYYDGLDDRIVIGDVELVSGNQLTVATWFRTTSLGGEYWEYDRPIVSKLFYDIGFYLGGSVYDDEKIEFVMFNNSSRAVSDNVLNDNKWHLAVGVYDGTLSSDNIKLYIDGQSQTQTASGISGNVLDIPEPLAIGANVRPDGLSFYPYDYFGGFIDDVRIYNRALSSEEIGQLYTIPEPCAFLLMAMAGMLIRKR